MALLVLMFSDISVCFDYCTLIFFLGVDASYIAHLRNGTGILNMGWEDRLPQSVFDKGQLRGGLNATVLLLSLCFGSSSGEWLHFYVPGYLSVAGACSA